MEAWWVAGPSTASVIRCLREVFARLGHPDLIVSDNGTAFTSEEMRAFLEARGIKQLTIAVYCAWSNGPAERAVRTIKEGLPKFEGTATERLLAVLEAARFTPGADGLSPAQRLWGWQPTTPLDRMRPTATPPPQGKGEEGEELEERYRFEPGEPVWVRQYGRKGTDKWAAGWALERQGNRLWMCECLKGPNVKRHVTQMRRRSGRGQEWRRPVGELSDSEETPIPSPRPWLIGQRWDEPRDLPAPPAEEPPAPKRAGSQDDEVTGAEEPEIINIAKLMSEVLSAARRRKGIMAEKLKLVEVLHEKVDEVRQAADALESLESGMTAGEVLKKLVAESEELELEASDVDEESLLKEAESAENGATLASGGGPGQGATRSTGGGTDS
ncbi:hypothetical protein FOCC_FOCC017867, partial [Frankliniella occidentalis]